VNPPPPLQPGRPISTLALTDCVDAKVLQEIQDNFESIARLRTAIFDAKGDPITRPTDTLRRLESDRAFDHLIEAERDSDGALRAPIVVEGQVLGSIAVYPKALAAEEALSDEDTAQLRAICDRLGIDGADRGDLLAAAEDVYTAKVGSSVQFIYMIAGAITRLCQQQQDARQRLSEMSVLYDISTALSAQHDLQHTLSSAASAAADALGVQAVVIRLLTQSDGKPQLDARAVHGMSRDLADRGRTLVNKSELTRKALMGEMIYIEDMTTDPRSYFPDEIKKEGLTSMLSTGMMYQGKGIGTIQLFTRTPRAFSSFEKNLTRAVAQLLATAIYNAQLRDEQSRTRSTVRQVRLARDVQRRMLPSYAPKIEGYDIAGTYVPSFDLGGDFYDYLNLDGSIGIAMGDVVGKGVAASLLMAHVRASLRAYAQDVYDLNRVMQRVNHALARDTRDNEFATLWYGTLDPETRRLTYCNAGHEPALLMRRGKITPLDVGGMVVGVIDGVTYEKAIVNLESGDQILLYTDGLTDAMSEDNQRFGRENTEHLMHEVGDMTAKQAISHIAYRVDQHQGTRGRTDDLTVVIIKVQ